MRVLLGQSGTRQQLPGVPAQWVNKNAFGCTSEGPTVAIHTPTSLRQAVIQDYLWLAEFGLTAFAPKFATRSDAYGTAACLTRAVNHLVLVLFALNRKYLINDKTALEEIAEFERAPGKFELRVRRTLGHLGSTATELASAVESVAQLFQETVNLTDGLYQPRYALRKRE